MKLAKTKKKSVFSLAPRPQFPKGQVFPTTALSVSQLLLFILLPLSFLSTHSSNFIYALFSLLGNFGGFLRFFLFFSFLLYF